MWEVAAGSSAGDYAVVGAGAGEVRWPGTCVGLSTYARDGMHVVVKIVSAFNVQQ